MDGQIRLAEGAYERNGRVEICYNGRWGSISSDSWDLIDTMGTCRELGFAGYHNY